MSRSSIPLRMAWCLLITWLLQATATARLYVADNTRNQIVIFPTDASGNTAPTVIIGGSNTGLSSPYGIATDANFIYVANYENSGGELGNCVTIYPLDASGNAAPVRTIIGSNTGLANCIGIAVDANYIYVVNQSAVGAAFGTVAVFDLNASGNATPVATIGGPNGQPNNTGLTFPFGIAVDATYIYVTCPSGGTGLGSLSIFPKAASGNVAPSVFLTNPANGLYNPVGIAVDGNNMYVTNEKANFQQVAVFALAGLNGGSTPSATITGAGTGLGTPNGVAVNATTIFARNSASESITEYPLTASGDVSPSATLGGIGTNSMILVGILMAADGTSFTHLSVSAPATATSGTPFNVTVTAEDDSGGTVTGYSGTVAFTSSDGAAVLPPNSTLTNGVGTFAVTLNTDGAQTVTATDTVSAYITGTSGNITVASAGPTATTTALGLSASTVVYGQPVTFTATVATSPPSGTVPTGTVQFSVNGGAVGPAVALNGSGQAMYTTGTLAAAGVGSPYLVGASYTPGSSSFSASASAGSSLTVDDAATTAQLASSANPSTSGQSVTFTATVTANLPSTATPAGTVQFYEGATAVGAPVPLSGGGQATFTTSTLPVGTTACSAQYAPAGGNFLASTSAALNQSVSAGGGGPVATTTALALSANAVVYGQLVTFTATVATSPPSGTVPSGPVQFSVNGSPVGAPVPLNGSGQATYTTGTLAAMGAGSPYAVDVSFAPGFSAFLASSSPASSLTVNAAATATSLALSSNDVTYGTPVTFTATVRANLPSMAVPTGTAQFSVNGSPLGAPITLNGGGQATFTTNALAATGAGSPYLVGVSYTPDSSSLTASTSAASSLTVTNTATTTTLALSSNSVTYGTPVTFTATVATSPASGTVPTGTVQFSVNGSPQGAPITLDGGGQATFTTNALAAMGVSSPYSVDASYAPSSSAFSASSSPASSLTVVAGGGGPAATTTALSLSSSSVTYGTPVTFTATVATAPPSGSVPAGTVQFSVNGSPQGAPITLDGGGQATFTTNALAAMGVSSPYSVDASYTPGSSAFSASSSAASSLTVVAGGAGPSATATTLSLSSSSVTYGTPVTFTATVATAPPSGSVPTGTVQFSVNGSPQGAPITLDGGGQATFTTNALAAMGASSPYAIDASYTPNSSAFSASSSAGYSLTVTAATPPVIAVAPAPEAVNAGANAGFWVLANGTAPLSYQWKFNGAPISGATNPLLLLADAQASNAGLYTVTVTNSAGSATSSSAALTVNSGGSGGAPGAIVDPFTYTMAGGGTIVLSLFPAGSGAIPASVSRGGASAGQGRPAAPRVDGAATYQWFLDGTAISGASDSRYIIRGVTPADDGSYTCLVTYPAGAVLSGASSVNVVSTASPGRLVNISCRADVGTGAGQLIAGYVVGGRGTSGEEPLLIRASGPALGPFGVTGLLADPNLTLNGSGGAIAANSGWAGNAQVAAAASQVGAFAWTSASSHDSALIESSPGGAYTAQITGASGDTGVALAEIYDDTPAGGYTPASPRLINISARAQVGAGGDVLIAGFVIGGTTSRTVLIRGSGPALAALGVQGTLPDPELQLYQSNAGGSSTLLESDTGWGGDPQIESTAASVGAFPWGSSATPDSAILITLPPGAYTAQVSGAGGDTGIALVEVYEVP